MPMAPLTIGTAAMTPTSTYSRCRLGPPRTNRAWLNTAWISSGLMMPIVEVTTIRTMTAVTWNRYGRNSGTIRRTLLRPARGAVGVVTMTRLLRYHDGGHQRRPIMFTRTSPVVRSDDAGRGQLTDLFVAQVEAVTQDFGGVLTQEGGGPRGWHGRVGEVQR